MRAAFTWTMARPKGDEVRFVLIEATLIRMERAFGGDWWVKSAYRAHPGNADQKAVQATEHLEAWGYALKRHVSVMQTNIDPLALFEESESNSKIGPLLQGLLDFQEGVL